MTFQISPLSSGPFRPLYGRSDADLLSAGVVAMIADSKPGFPCRVALREAEPGERCLLLNHAHQPADTPFRSAHAIFVIDGAQEAALAPDEIPDVMASRLLSVRAFDARHLMTDADVVEGQAAAALFERFLSDPQVSYLQAHYARRGCFAAQVRRA